jgi:alkylation response protein AidB-like acyl-CoA dehydrogenase
MEETTMKNVQDYREFRDNLRRLALDKVAPHAAAYDRDGRFPEESLEAFKQLGLVGLAFNENNGGQGGDVVAQCIALEEIARVCASSSLTLMVIWAGLVPVAKHGGPELIERVVRPAMAGGTVASICLTEPHCGSDLFGLKTTAKRDGSDWLINGQKRYISNAGRSDWYTVLARTGEKKFGLFAVHKDDPGFVVGKKETKLGIKGSPTADLNFDDCRIPGFRAVGDETKGYDYISDSLTWTRTLIGAQALGIAQGALDQAVQYTSERQQFGQILSKFQMLRGMIAEMATAIEAGRSLLYCAAQAIDQGDPNARKLGSMAKLFCSDTAMKATVDALQMHGGAGYMADFPIERMMRDAKITQIYEGANEIQKLIVAKEVYDQRSQRS